MLGLLFVLLVCLEELKTPGDGILALFQVLEQDFSEELD